MNEPRAGIPPQPIYSHETTHLRNPFAGFEHHPASSEAPTFASELDPNLQNLTYSHHLGDPSHAQQLQLEHQFSQKNAASSYQDVHSRPPPAQRRANLTIPQSGQFGILTPQSHLLQVTSYLQTDAVHRLPQNDATATGARSGSKTESHFANMKMIPDPPDLQRWRERLFNVDELMTLTEDEYDGPGVIHALANFRFPHCRFLTYFPHVDNVYSHRSTQRYKRKPFISHYWDCRLKGRPAGTPKSDDPNKKKRKRHARERDLCDVKIKITEYFPGARSMMGPDFAATDDSSHNIFSPDEQFGPSLHQEQQSQPFDMLASVDGAPSITAENNGGKYYTIQRVNGNGGNGKGDGVAGPHKHTLEESDRVKKNSVTRCMIKEEKEKKKTTVSCWYFIFS